MHDLFAKSVLVPLAEQLRPQTFDEVIGQQHLIGVNGPIRLMYEDNALQSMILWGPPGVGKTTIAKILARKNESKFIVISAVLSGVTEIREAIQTAKNALLESKKTIVFVDEVHRFNKAQQDAFLPHVESGLIVLVGATTENPSFEVNSALLSRSVVYVLKPLERNELSQLAQKILALPAYIDLSIDDEVLSTMIDFVDGDARRLINTMEQLLMAGIHQNKKILDKNFYINLLGDKIRRFDRKGDQFYEQISALHKSVRGSHPNAALYWFCRMLDGGADPKYLARRIMRMAWEDVGLADPRAIEIASHACLTYERLGSPEGELALAEAVIFLATAAKSNAAYKAYNEAMKFVKNSSSQPAVPLHLKNAPTQLMKDMNYGKDYRYAHDEPNAYAAGETYMPDNLPEIDWYQPVDRGLEIKIKEKLNMLKELDAIAKKNKSQ